MESLYSTLLYDKNEISPFFLNEIFSENHAAYMQFNIDNNKELKRIILSMYQEQLEKDIYSEEIINGLMMIFLYRLVRNCGIAVQGSETIIKRNEVARIYRYMMQHFSNASLHDLADLLQYSDTYCSVYIKKVTGFSFSQLMKQFRFRKAIGLLKNTNMKIQNISEQLGYHDCENFIRAFRKEYVV